MAGTITPDELTALLKQMPNTSGSNFDVSSSGTAIPGMSSLPSTPSNMAANPYPDISAPKISPEVIKAAVTKPTATPVTGGTTAKTNSPAAPQSQDTSSYGLSPELLAKLNDAYGNAATAQATPPVKPGSLLGSGGMGILAGILALASRGKAGANPLDNSAAFAAGGIGEQANKQYGSEIEQQDKYRQLQQEKLQNLSSMLMKQPEIALNAKKTLADINAKQQELNLAAKKQELEKMQLDNTISKDVKEQKLNEYNSAVKANEDMESQRSAISKFLGVHTGKQPAAPATGAATNSITTKSGGTFSY